MSVLLHLLLLLRESKRLQRDMLRFSRVVCVCVDNLKEFSDSSTNQLSVRGTVGGAMVEKSSKQEVALSGVGFIFVRTASRFDVMRTRKHLVRNCQFWLNFISSLFLSFLCLLPSICLFFLSVSLFSWCFFMFRCKLFKKRFQVYLYIY